MMHELIEINFKTSGRYYWYLIQQKSNISDGYCHNHYYPSVRFVECLHKLAANMPTITLSH